MKNMAEKGEIVVKKWVLGAKSGLLGAKNNGRATKLERLNGAKCRFCSSKQTKQKE